MFPHDLTQIALRYKGFSDLYVFFSVVGKCCSVTFAVENALLPRKNSCNLAYLQDLAEGKKKYLQRKDVPQIQVPQWPELSTKRLM